MDRHLNFYVFWVVTQRKMVLYGRFRTAYPIRTIFKGQGTAWPYKMEPIVSPEKSVQNGRISNAAEA
jgi:hypothetical protein